MGQAVMDLSGSHNGTVMAEVVDIQTVFQLKHDSS
jgi:hypothetical protein